MMVLSFWLCSFPSIQILLFSIKGLTFFLFSIHIKQLEVSGNDVSALALVLRRTGNNIFKIVLELFDKYDTVLQ